MARRATPGRRIAWGLAALGAVSLGLAALLSLVTGPTPAPTAVDAVVGPPWAACTVEVRRQLGAPRVEVRGPDSARWESTGQAVAFEGSAGDPGAPELRFACQAVHVGAAWVAERLVFVNR